MPARAAATAAGVGSASMKKSKPEPDVYKRQILGSVDKPTEGKVLIEGTELSAMNRTQAAIFRRRKVGLVYQFYNLIPTLTVRKNILMPLLLDLSLIHI